MHAEIDAVDRAHDAGIRSETGLRAEGLPVCNFCKRRPKKYGAAPGFG